MIKFIVRVSVGSDVLRLKNKVETHRNVLWWETLTEWDLLGTLEQMLKGTNRVARHLILVLTVV